MAIIKNGIKMYEGAVLKIDEHYWLDGMLEEWAVVWDMEAHDMKRITVGYYGSDCCNMCDAYAEIDRSEAVTRDILRTLKGRARVAFAESVVKRKIAVCKGDTAEVVKGRKVPRGTILNVFWVGERETYRSRQYSWMNETETVAGAFDQDGNKIWIKAEYLKNITPLKSPNAKERDKFIKAWIKKNAQYYGINVR